ncbi:MAG: Uma2 family endonuclease [Fulvimarina manganoxydans]|uniref:Uma2 family endonuclease n=1 Tax=Fulvimarina manganoxydans TaxID=937218 RepID=UPI0023570764|nr:Uma2 family endonuclease [Fulvimarina manganoxydans]MCK5933892.1 Uma2 family endonuclease [Fulvimarina manganoxydans]
MSGTAAKRWTLQEFLDWEERQEHRHEFVDGDIRMITGGTKGHAGIARNILFALYGRLRGSPCLPFGSDLRVTIPSYGNVRYPDVTVDCGRQDPDAQEASKPVVVFEVLSKSTAWYDQTRKFRDYEACPDILHYVCVSQSEVRVSVWLRDGDGRLVAQDDITDLTATLDLPAIRVDLALADIYEGLAPILEPQA